MSFATFVMMIVILAVVWGGFAFTIRLALKRDKAEERAHELQ